VYSLNVPVPGRVARLASGLAPELARFDRQRDRHTLVLKRLGDPAPEEYPRVRHRVRQALAGTAPFEARIAGLDWFAEPTAGPGPVVYLAVESPGLEAAHRRLADALSAAEGVEGEAYVPHVTLARGGDPEDARAVVERDVETVDWTVDDLVFWDGTGRGGAAGRLSLPA